MLISTEMKLYYDIVSGKYDKNTKATVEGIDMAICEDVKIKEVFKSFQPSS